MNAPLTFPSRVRDNAKDKDAEIARLRTELQEVRAELEDLREQHADLIDTLAGATVSAHGPDGTFLGSMRLLDELLWPGSRREGQLQIPAPAPDVPPSQAPEQWSAWLHHRQRKRTT
jgi:hypothetical protein